MQQALPRSARRVAFFGGSFDPPHCGHLAIARAAQRALALDCVLFAPVGAQPLKPQGSTASFDERVAMTRLAVDDEPGFAVSLVDTPKLPAAPNYTIDTLLELRQQLPAGGAFFFLMGADSFLGIRRWHRAAEIPIAASLVVASRPGDPLDDLLGALPEGLSLLPAAEAPGAAAATQHDVRVERYQVHNAAGASAPLYLLPGLHFEVSASQIREAIRHQDQGLDAAGVGPNPVLTPKVLGFIHANGLYRQA